jgi:hypothetical protein
MTSSTPLNFFIIITEPMLVMSRWEWSPTRADFVSRPGLPLELWLTKLLLTTTQGLTQGPSHQRSIKMVKFDPRHTISSTYSSTSISTSRRGYGPFGASASIGGAGLASYVMAVGRGIHPRRLVTGSKTDEDGLPMVCSQEVMLP